MQPTCSHAIRMPFQSCSFAPFLPCLGLDWRAIEQYLAHEVENLFLFFAREANRPRFLAPASGLERLRRFQEYYANRNPSRAFFRPCRGRLQPSGLRRSALRRAAPGTALAVSSLQVAHSIRSLEAGFGILHIRLRSSREQVARMAAERDCGLKAAAGSFRVLNGLCRL